MKGTFVFVAATCLAAPTAAQVRRVVPTLRAGPSVTPLPVFTSPLSAPSAERSAPSLSASFVLTSLGLSPALSIPGLKGPVAAAKAGILEDPTPVEAAAVYAAKTFDGTVPAPVAPPVVAPSLGAGLRTLRAEDETWLANVVAQMAATRTGRRILRGVAVLVGERGYPTLVDVSLISSLGEFRYDSDLVVIDASYRRSDPALTAPILAHELQHVLRSAQGLPVDALEHEIEAYTVENRVWSELGVEPPKGSLVARTRRRFLKGVEVFVPWLAKEYKNNFLLYGDTMAKYIQKAEKSRATTIKCIARAEKDIVAAERAIVKMRAAGMPEEAIAAHKREALESAQRRLFDARVMLGWRNHDLALLADETGRARFRVYSRGVIRRARALSR